MISQSDFRLKATTFTRKIPGLGVYPAALDGPPEGIQGHQIQAPSSNSI
jgi:hypothetical protein